MECKTDVETRERASERGMSMDIIICVLKTKQTSRDLFGVTLQVLFVAGPQQHDHRNGSAV